MLSDAAPSTLERHLNRYVSILLLLVVAVVPTIMCGLLYLSRVPDVTWQRGELTYDRVWLARTRRPVGIGYETQRIRGQFGEGGVCVENKVRFFLWSRSPDLNGLNAAYAQSMVLTEYGWQATGQACP
jgi:hypothetical protein